MKKEIAANKTIIKSAPMPSSSLLVKSFLCLVIFVIFLSFSMSAVAQGWAVYAWSGDLGSLPPGYVLCDGTNGTPDLRDKFLVGAGLAYALDDTGGTSKNDLSHRHAVDDHKHSINAVEAHSHALTKSNRMVMPGGNAVLGDVTMSPAGGHDHGGLTGLAAPNTDYQLSAEVTNLPPYHALYYVCGGLPALTTTEPYTFTVSSGQVVKIQRSMSYADLAIIGLLVCILMIVVIGLIFWAITRRS